MLKIKVFVWFNVNCITQKAKIRYGWGFWFIQIAEIRYSWGLILFENAIIGYGWGFNLFKMLKKIWLGSNIVENVKIRYGQGTAGLFYYSKGKN